MNAQEKEKIEILKEFTLKKYYDILEQNKKNTIYKNLDAKFLKIKRRKFTALLRFFGAKDFRGRVYGKNNIMLIKNDHLVSLHQEVTKKLCKHIDFEPKNPYSRDFLHIISHFIECFKWGGLDPRSTYYFIEYTIPTLKDEKNEFVVDLFKSSTIKTDMHSYHFFPDCWSLPKTPTLKKPLIGLEMELYHQNKEIFNNLTNFFYFQHDGSLYDDKGGVELTTRPMEFEDLVKDGGIVDIICRDFLPRFHCYSKCANETGFHIHISKIKRSEVFNRNLLKAFYSFSHDFVEELFGRQENNYCFCYEPIKHLKKYYLHPLQLNLKGQNVVFNEGCSSRYMEINLQKMSTIEFRRGKGTVDPEEIKSMIDFCYNLFMYTTINNADKDIKSIKKELLAFLEEKSKTERLKELIIKHERYN